MISQRAKNFSISGFLKFLPSFFGKAREFRAARGRWETLAGGFSLILFTNKHCRFPLEKRRKNFCIGARICPTASGWAIFRVYTLNIMLNFSSAQGFSAQQSLRHGFAVPPPFTQGRRGTAKTPSQSVEIFSSDLRTVFVAFSKKSDASFPEKARQKLIYRENNI